MNELLIYGIISWWGGDDTVSARQVMDKLRAFDGEDVLVRINSLGGDVIEGTAIYTALQTYSGRVVVQIDGYAMSMASVIAMAGDEIRISEAGGIMIHSPWSDVAGNAKEMRKEADVLDTIQGSLIKAYQRRLSSMSVEEIADLLETETWLDADQALKMGLVDSKIEPMKMAALFSPEHLARFSNVPAKVLEDLEKQAKAKAEQEEPAEEGQDAPEAEESAEDDQDTPEAEEPAEEGQDAPEAEELAEEDQDTPEAEESAEDDPDTLEPETEEPAPAKAEEPTGTERALAIMQACNVAGLPHLAEQYIGNEALTVSAVKMMVNEIKVGIEAHPSQLSQGPKPQPTGAAATEAQSIWKNAHAAAKVNRKN